MKTVFWKKALALLLVMLTLSSTVILSANAETLNNSGVDVKIISFMRGEQTDLRSSELLEAHVTGYDGNVQDLTYEWTNTLGTYLYVYNSHNMYYINNTDGEIEIYNSKIKPSTNMAGRTYENTFSGQGYCWAAIYGSNNSGAGTSIEDTSAYNGTISVTVKDKDGKVLATDSHTGKVTTTGYWWWQTTTYSGIVDHSLQADMDDVTIGMFEGDTRNVKDLLGESAILHITCVESNVSSGSVVSGKEYISLSGDATNDYYITGIKAGSSTDKTGDAQVKLKIEKNTCKFHEKSSAEATTTVYVFKKPTTSTTAYTLTLTGNIDDRCTYYINGNPGVRQTENGVTTILFTGLTPNTSYQVEVRGHYKDENNIDRIAYAYVYDTTKPVYTGTVEVYLDGEYDSATHTVTSGTKVNLEDVAGASQKTIFVKEVNGTKFIELQKKADTVGTYSSILDSGSYHLYYSAYDSSQIDQQLLTMHNADRTRYLFYNSVKYYSEGNLFDTQYHVFESTVNTIGNVPVKDGYVFMGWQDADGNLYASDSLLTDHISKPYVLNAVWEKAINVYVNFEIDHYNDKSSSYYNDDDRHNLSFDLMSRQSSAGDYEDVFNVPIEIKWDGNDGTFSNDTFDMDYVVSESNNILLTKYTAQNPVLANVPVGSEYSVEVIKSGYEIKSVTSETDENGNVTINVLLEFEPKNADLEFTVELSEDAKELVKAYPEYKPQAVHVKVLSWYTKGYTMHGHTIPDKSWAHISQHHDTYVTLYLDENGKATGSYPVWMHNNSKSEYYHYRIKVVSYVLADGTIIHTHDDSKNKDVEYISDGDRYIATIAVNGGKSPDLQNTTLNGAHFDSADLTQQGELKATIDIKTHNVTFDPDPDVNGNGMLNGSTDNLTLTQQIKVPDLSKYVPNKEGGYVFGGWFLADEKGNMTDTQVESFAELTKDITLIAKWKAPLTVEGQVFVAGYYHLPYNPDETIKIPEHDRTHAVTIYLQKLLDNNYAETVQTQKDTVAYEDVQGSTAAKPMGTASYSFTGIPDDGHRYRILIQNPNYSVKYQNEQESLDESLIMSFDHESYDTTEGFNAEYKYGKTDVATINAFMEFTPQNFDLKYKVIASSIGEGYRPGMTEILIHCDDGNSGAHPQDWPVISQMVRDNENVGQENGFDESGISLVTDSQGKVSNIVTYPVWMVKTDGHSLYDYAVSLDSYEIGNDTIAFNAEAAPFYVAYNGSARYSALENLDPEHQTQLLTVELLPKRYTVNFLPGFELTMDDYITEFEYRVAPGKYQTSHIWSYDTILDKEPTRPGYKFLYWEDENGNKVTKIDASVANDVTLTAVWEELFTVTFHTNNDNVDSKGIFRVYYENNSSVPEGAFTLTKDNKVEAFYDLPVFTDSENNKYIFKGWYLAPDDESDPISWNKVYSEHTNVYAHWIKVESVAQDEADSKKIPYPDAMYPEYDLTGVQIRDIKKDNSNHGGVASTGLRFITVLSDKVYDEINTIKTFDAKIPNTKGAEYGYVVARTDTTKAAAEFYGIAEDDYRLQYCGTNVNGVDTSRDYRYVQNMRCSGYDDHRVYNDYRLYTAVITYDGIEGDALKEAQDTLITARSYIRYTDANGLYRTYYNNYTGNAFSFGGCSASFTSASGLMGY